MKTKIKKQKIFTTKYSQEYLKMKEKIIKKNNRLRNYIVFPLLILGIITGYFMLEITLYIFISIAFVIGSFMKLNNELFDIKEDEKSFKSIKEDFINNKNNINYRNNQNYIYNKNLINKKLLFTLSDIDELEEKYTFMLFIRIILSFIFLIIISSIGFGLEDTNTYGEVLLTIFSFKTAIIGIAILNIIYIFYNAFLFYKKQLFFYPRRKKIYTVLKYSPHIKNTQIINKINKGKQDLKHQLKKIII